MANILETFEALHPTSKQMAARAASVFPSGVTHDARAFEPFPIYVERAAGARKWDVDGNEIVDYIGGHGALLLGHNRPEVVEAIHGALARGTHFGSSHDLEIEWGEQVLKMVPCGERVRFTSSGTEATMIDGSSSRAAARATIAAFRSATVGGRERPRIGSTNGSGCSRAAARATSAARSSATVGARLSPRIGSMNGSGASRAIDLARKASRSSATVGGRVRPLIGSLNGSALSRSAARATSAADSSSTMLVANAASASSDSALAAEAIAELLVCRSGSSAGVAEVSAGLRT